MDGVAILRVDVPIYFANAQSIKTRLKNFEELLQVGATFNSLLVGPTSNLFQVGQGVALCPAWPFLDRDGLGGDVLDPPSRSICAIPHKCLPIGGSLFAGVMCPPLDFILP